jgi:hypothetical protein
MPEYPRTIKLNAARLTPHFDRFLREYDDRAHATLPVTAQHSIFHHQFS